MTIKRTRKWLSILLSLALLVSFAPLTVNALAAETDNIEVTITLPKVGQQSNAVAFVSAEPEKYTVTVNGVWRDAGGYDANEFRDGNEYSACFAVTPQSGYTLTANTTVTINGELLDESCYLGGSTTPAAAFDYKCMPVLEGTIDEISLTDVPTGAIGTTAAPYSHVEPNFEVNGIWEYYDFADNSYKPMGAADTFADGKLYRLNLLVNPKAGYMLSYDCALLINGEIRNDFAIGELQGNCCVTVSHAEQIERITIDEDGLPAAKIGESFSASVNIPVPEGSNYTASGYWYTDDGMGQITSGTFEKGKEYYLHITVRAKEGYSFPEHIGLWIGNEPSWIVLNGGAEVYTERRTSFATLLSQVELLNLPEAKLGEKLQEGGFAVSVPAGENYTAEAVWTVYDEQMQAWKDVEEADGSNTVQAGKKYSLDVWAYPKEGYEFSEEVIVNAYGVDRRTDAEYSWLYYYEEFSFRKVVDMVQVNGFVQPEVGKDATTDGLKVPGNGNYEIVHAVWLDADSNVQISKFEAGHSYVFELVLTPKAGFEFDRSIKVLMGGKVHTDQRFVDEKEVCIQLTHSFKEVIPQVKLEDLPQMQVGQTAKTEVKLPADAKYTTQVLWQVWNDTMESYEPFEGTFAAGKVYNMAVLVTPKDGYRITEDGTKFFVDGQESSEFHVFGEMAVYEKEFETEQKLITKIELKIEKPVAGHHASISPVLTIVSGTGAKLNGRGNLPAWIEGDLENYYEVDGLFAADGQYGVRLPLVAGAGYRFADDLVVVVNGVTLPKDAVEAWYKTVNAEYFFSMKNAPAVNGSDNQGDGAALSLWAGFMVLSLAAFVTCVLTKKREANR